MKKKFGAFGAGQFSLETLVGGRPGTTIFQNPGGGGGLGGVAYKDRARPPPRDEEAPCTASVCWRAITRVCALDGTVQVCVCIRYIFPG